MHATQPVGGIRGLLPLVRELCPSAITYPTRYEGLRGKRLAVDATLLVQRFHFAPDPHEKRHLIGTYRLLQTFKQHDITPIMVFDHAQARVPQKQRLLEKRRSARHLLQRRAEIEARRARRLKELSKILSLIQVLPEEDVQQVKRLFDAAQAEAAWDNQPDEAGLETDDEPLASVQGTLYTELDPAVLERLAAAHEWLKEPDTLDFDPWRAILEVEAPDTEALASRLSTLHQSFRSTSPSTQPEAETSAQAALTTTEASIYAALRSDEPQPLAEQLDQVFQRNVVLSEHYNRVSARIPSDLFDSTAKLCELFGVPVLWTGSGLRTGPYAGKPQEAEAVASALVLHGWADAVVSEDSDVILYGVPMLRGLMGSKTKMEWIDSAHVRRTLFPPTDADDGETDSQNRMLEFALLAGTDYNRTLTGVAAKTALKLVGEHATIVNILRRFPKKYQPPDGLTWQAYKRELHDAREVFKKPPSIRRYLPLLRVLRDGPSQQTTSQQPAQPIEHFLSNHGIDRSEFAFGQHSLEGQAQTTPAAGFGGDFFGEAPFNPTSNL